MNAVTSVLRRAAGAGHHVAWRLLAIPLLLVGAVAQAEPYLAVEHGLKCIACHVNPTGGGLRNAFGVQFMQRTLAANPLPAPLSDWDGRIGEYLRVGGDLRTGETRTRVSGQSTQKVSGLDQARLYLEITLLPDWVGLVLDETVAPGDATRQEAYVRLSTPGMGWTLKAGQFYLPFGWRLQDNTTFVRSVSGIGMTTPDKGVELGLERGDWSAQLAWTNGPGNAGLDAGHQVTGQVVWVQGWGRIGAAVASTISPRGNRQVTGLYGGLRTGPLSWLGELDLVRDAGFPEGRRTLLAALGEVNWRIAQGHNLKAGAEYFDPDRDIGHDHKVRHSLVYEYSPWALVQLRAGWRRNRGIPQSPVDNRRLLFAELHALF